MFGNFDIGKFADHASQIVKDFESSTDAALGIEGGGAASMPSGAVMSEKGGGGWDVDSGLEDLMAEVDAKKATPAPKPALTPKAAPTPGAGVAPKKVLAPKPKPKPTPKPGMKLVSKIAKPAEQETPPVPPPAADLLPGPNSLEPARVASRGPAPDAEPKPQEATAEAGKSVKAKAVPSPPAETTKASPAEHAEEDLFADMMPSRAARVARKPEDAAPRPKAAAPTPVKGPAATGPGAVVGSDARHDPVPSRSDEDFRREDRTAEVPKPSAKPKTKEENQAAEPKPMPKPAAKPKPMGDNKPTQAAEVAPKAAQLADTPTAAQSGSTGDVEESLRATVAKLTARVEASDEDSGPLKAELTSLREALAAREAESLRKVEEMTALQKKVSALSAAKDKLSKQLEKEAEERRDLEATNEELSTRLGGAERKVYALTKERDMLKKDAEKKGDVSTLLLEKDEIIKQVMSEGEELSKKQAAQEQNIKKVRSRVKELENEKQRVESRLQVEEARVESLRADKARTEEDLKHAVEQTAKELESQKLYYLEQLEKVRAESSQAGQEAEFSTKAQMERSVKEQRDREAALTETIHELRGALARHTSQAVHREEMLRRDVVDLEARCQAAETRHEELAARLPESTRPLLRQIEAMQAQAAQRTEAWTGVERSLNIRCQEAETKATGAAERERKAQASLVEATTKAAALEAELLDITAKMEIQAKTMAAEKEFLEKRAQDIQKQTESATSQEWQMRALQSGSEERERLLQVQLAEERGRREAAVIESEKARLAALEKDNVIARQEREIRMLQATSPAQQNGDHGTEHNSEFATVGTTSGHSSDVEGGPARDMSQTARSKMQQLQNQIRHKDGELQLLQQQVSSLEQTRLNLAEELVKAASKMDEAENCIDEVTRLKAELEQLKIRHFSALELMGERDEQVEELQSDLADLKQMYREQVDSLVKRLSEKGQDTSDIPMP
mmetsp:Transcript_7272/g.13648  ORF Transcript_7272/g.13648 Transcript_7272/m.13648 type:complete len:967 (+) Transcript_7272:118-3018(+)